MRTVSLLFLIACMTASAARAGFWDAVKEKAKLTAEKTKRARRQKKATKTQAVSAVRGLEEDEDGKKRGKEPRDYESLEWLESLEVTDEDVNRFVKEGRLAS